jgi:hypothetical protein
MSNINPEFGPEFDPGLVGLLGFLRAAKQFANRHHRNGAIGRRECSASAAIPWNGNRSFCEISANSCNSCKALPNGGSAAVSEGALGTHLNFLQEVQVGFVSLRFEENAHTQETCPHPWPRARPPLDTAGCLRKIALDETFMAARFHGTLALVLQPRARRSGLFGHDALGGSHISGA